MKVAKFGGSSMADATQVEKVANIIKADKDRKVVVVSAAGKRNSEDSKITDLLYLCYAHIQYHQDCSDVFNKITARYKQIIADLNVDMNLDDEFAALKQKLDAGNITEDELVSRGEYFSAKIIAKYLGYKFVDATECIKFNFDKCVHNKNTYAAISKIKIGKGIVVPGFYGADPDGKITTFSRGGSDITGSILSVGFNADIYENWTDVSGILMADPSIVKDPKTITTLTFEELRLLSYYGAKVLHEGAVYPVRQNNIPLNIKNTNNPEDPGSLITNDASKVKDADRFITGISGRCGFTIIVLTKHQMNGNVSDLTNVLKILRDWNIDVDYVNNGIDSISVAIQDSKIKDNLHSLISQFENNVKPESIKVHENIAIVAAVGSGMVASPGVSGQIFSALGDEDINIRIINQGPDESTIIFGVANSDFDKVIQTIYKIFVA